MSVKRPGVIAIQTKQLLFATIQTENSFNDCFINKLIHVKKLFILISKC